MTVTPASSSIPIPILTPMDVRLAPKDFRTPPAFVVKDEKLEVALVVSLRYCRYCSRFLLSISTSPKNFTSDLSANSFSFIKS